MTTILAALSSKTVALTFAQQKTMAEQLLAISRDSPQGDVEILGRAEGQLLHSSSVPVELLPSLRQALAQVGSELYAERGRGTRARHLARGALLLLLTQLKKKDHEYDPLGVLIFTLDEIFRADGDASVMGRLRLSGRDRERAEALFEKFCSDPTLSDEELLARSKEIGAKERVVSLLSARLCSDAHLASSVLGNAAASDEHRRLARGALSYLAENDDAIRDNLGTVGHVDDMYVLNLAMGRIAPRRLQIRALVNELLREKPFLTRLHLSLGEEFWIPSEFSLLTAAAIGKSSTPRIAVIASQTAGLALSQGILLALEILQEGCVDSDTFRPLPGEHISPVNESSPAQVEGYYDDELRPCPREVATKVGLRHSTGPKKPSVKRYKDVSDLKRYVRVSAPKSKAGVQLRDRDAEVEFGPLEVLFGATRPVRKKNLRKRVVVVAPLQASRETLTKSLLYGQALSRSIPCGRIHFDDSGAIEMWSDNAPEESCLLTVVRNSTQAALLAERWQNEQVTVLLPVEESERSEADLARMTSIGTKVVAFVPTRSLEVQSYFGAANYNFLDWTPDLARLTTLIVHGQNGSLGKSEGLAVLPLLNRVDVHELCLPETDEAFECLQGLHRAARREYGDDPDESFARFLEGATNAFFLLSAALEEEELRDAKERISKANGDLKAHGRYWDDRLLAVAGGFLRALEALSARLGADNPKANTIRELTRESRSAQLVCPLERLEQTRRQFPDTRVATLASIRDAESLLIPKWLGERKMLRFFFPPPAPQTHFVFYSWEVLALRRRTKLRKRLIGEHEASPSLPELFDTGQRWEAPAPPTPIPTEHDKTEEDIEAWIQRARLQRALSAANPNSQDGATLETRLYMLSDGHYVYYTPNHSVIRIDGLDTREVAEGKAVQQVPAMDLKVGDLIVESLGTERDLIREWADQELPTGCRKLARRWHGPLQKLRDQLSSDQDVYRKLQAAGCKRHSVTIRGWLHSTHLIGPNDGEDLDIIAKVTADAELSNKLDEVFEAIHVVRNAHLRAATKLQRHLESKVAQQVSSGDGLKESVLLEDNLLLLRVEDILSDKIHVSQGIANKVRES